VTHPSGKASYRGRTQAAPQNRASSMAAEVEFSWRALLDSIRATTPHLYRNWFENLAPPTLQGGQLQIVVDDPARVHFLRGSCSDAFVRNAIRLTGRLISVRFISPAADTKIAAGLETPGLLTSGPLSADYTFDQFVVGTSNRLAHAACRAVCTHPGSVYNPLFIHGPSGLGKTHLLQATSAELLACHPTMRVAYISCELFINDFVRAIESGQLPEFRERARQADALIIDDIQFLANRESSQEELFHTFNTLHQAGRQIILSADSAPAKIPTLEDRLVTRFNWGLVTEIGPPNREMRQAILHKKARLRGYELPDEILDFIAAHIESNVRTLEGALTRLISETQIAGRPLNLDTTRAVLDHLQGHPTRRLQVNEILAAVSSHFSLRLPDLIGRKRSRSISQPRQLAMYLARKLTPLSLQEIGLHFGNRDHSTVLHAERTVEANRLKDKNTADALARLTDQLLRRP
jgi:chromosomal replication initiator protein